jgi:membrane protein YdbS with pleckstrin-like domain
MFVPTVTLFIILLAVPFAFYFLINALYPAMWASTTIFPLGVLCASVYYLSIFLFFYSQFIEFYLDIWIVTNDRIIDIEQEGLFARTISELDLYRIQDVTTEVNGVFPTFFHYGNVIIKTASSNSHVTFRHVSHPNEIRQALIQLSESDRKFHHSQ